MGGETVLGGASFDIPVGLHPLPHRPGEWYVAQRGAPWRLDEVGEIWRVIESPSGLPTIEVFLDLAGDVAIFDKDGSAANEAGVLGLALHPDFPGTPYVYVSFTEPDDGHAGPFTSVVARFTTLDGGSTASPESRLDILRLPQVGAHHNGGGIGFGPDGLLYVGFGDGDNTSAIQAQDVSSWFGSILRIDVDAAEPYAIPPGNPFAAGGGAPEIFAWGLRNPWRWSFDRETGELYVGDVGWNTWEEVNRVQIGGNYGWPYLEGPLCLSGSCEDPAFIAPIVAHRHADLTPPGDALAIIGGYVYRGMSFPELRGHYVYADTNGNVWTLAPGETRPVLQISGGNRIYSLAEDLDGELYLLGGRISRIVRAPGSAAEFPALLSRTGCFDPSDPSVPVPAAIPYEVNAPLWSDGAEKRRWLALPDGARIEIHPDGDLELPVGSVLMKEFSLAGRPVETRLFVRHDDGDWAGYSYEWSEDGTDAGLLEEGKQRDWEGQQWTYPSRIQCLSCHTAAAGRVLGLTLGQLNRHFQYPATGRRAQQLRTLWHLDLFADPPAGHIAQLPILPGEGQAWAPVAARARAYLDANCSGCHRAGGPTQSTMDLRHDRMLGEMGVCLVAAQLGDLGLVDPVLVDPADPHRSVLLMRSRATDAFRMPPLATDLVDEQGTARIEAWIGAIRESAGECIGVDSDADGWLDDVDACPSVADTGNLDSDGDGLGDLCQCGDVSGDGVLDAVDVGGYRRVLVGEQQAHAVPERCNVWEDGSPCDLVDLVVLQRAAISLEPGVQRYCGAADADGDGVPDGEDNCPRYWNPEHLDSNGNGRGDACECGDQNEDGRVDLLDMLEINLVVFGQALASELCDANDDGLCNIEDLIGVNASLFGAETYCARFPSPGP